MYKQTDVCSITETEVEFSQRQNCKQTQFCKKIAKMSDSDTEMLDLIAAGDSGNSKSADAANSKPGTSKAADTPASYELPWCVSLLA